MTRSLWVVLVAVGLGALATYFFIGSQNEAIARLQSAIASQEAALADIRKAVVPAAPAASSGPTIDTGLNPETLDMLRAGGFVIFVRHADRDDNEQIDAFDRMSLVLGRRYPEDFGSGVCLNETGSAVSKVLGQAMQIARIPVGQIYSSPICRAVETAVLSTGRQPDVLDERLIYQTMSANADESRSILTYIETLLKTVPETGNTFIFSHNNLINKIDRPGFNELRLAQGGFAVIRPLGDDYEVVTVASLLDLTRQLKIAKFASN